MRFCLNHPTRGVFSKGLCIECYRIAYQKPLKRTVLKKKPYVIRAVSNSRKKLLEVYRRLRKIFLEEHTTCEIRGLNCLRIATEIHHTRGKEGLLLIDVQWWKSVCRNCHNEITEHSKKAIEEGHSHSRHKKESNEEGN